MIADKYQRELRISANQHGKEKKLNYNSPLENQTWLKTDERSTTSVNREMKIKTVRHLIHPIDQKARM